jgi:hypothetical protein
MEVNVVLKDSQGHTQNMSCIQLEKWHMTQIKPEFHNGIEIKW